ncbi:YHYH domain-containing protein [Intestinibacter sp.]
MKNKIFILTIILTLIMTSVSFAHSGRTDSSGGHRDNKNKSGLGSYHYHCGGYPAHLHKNGVCPYSSSSNKNNNTGNNTSKRPSTSTQNTIEVKKQEAAKKGYNDGYEVGYQTKNSSDCYYSGDYKTTYDTNYSKGYEEGASKLKKDIEEVKTIAYQKGLNGEELNHTYTHEALKIAYEESYENGYNEYIEIEKEKYKKQGKEDGQKDNQKQVFSDDINKEFVDAYNLAYESEQEILCSNYKNSGFKDAIQSIDSKASNLKKAKFAGWYKEGYEKGCTELKQAKTDAYNQGYNKEEFSVAQNMELVSAELEEHYNKGLEKRKSEDSKTATNVGIGAVIASGAGFLFYRNKKKKIS